MTDLVEAERTDETLPGEPVTAATTIIAALITASATVASAAATTATGLLTQTGSAVNQAGVIANATFVDLKKCFGATPSSGAFYEAPPLDVASIPSPELAFEMWKISSDSPESVKKVKFKNITDAQAELLAVWIEDTLGPKSKSALTYVMKSTGAGVEGVTLYEMDAPVWPDRDTRLKLYVALYLNNPKVGDIEAGGFIMSESMFEMRIGAIDKVIQEDPELQKVIHYIQENKLYSSGESKTFEVWSDSNPEPAPYVYHLEYQAAEVVTFDLYSKLGRLDQ